MLIDKLEKSITDLNSKTNKNWGDISVQSALQSAYDKLMKHYSKTNWVYCAVLMLDPRHKEETPERPLISSLNINTGNIKIIKKKNKKNKEETFYLTSWGKEMAQWSISKFEDIYKTRYYQKEETTQSPAC